jgi:hypothetical protein
MANPNATPTLERLALKAQAEKLWIRPQPDGWTYQVQSKSRPGQYHLVRLYGRQHSCTCEAWSYDLACKHWAHALNFVSRGRITNRQPVQVEPKTRRRRAAVA